MSFLTPILLAGIAAFTIPLVIHLLNRRRYREVPWGAMHLLEMTVSQNRRRLRLLELLLLLTRVAIPIILALCLAGPIVKGLRNFMGQNASTVVLLDDSYSMQAPDAGGVAFSRSRDEIGAILEGLPRGSEAQVVMMGAGAPLVDAPTSVLPKLVEELREREAVAGPIDAAGSLRLAGAQLGAMGSPAAEVIVMSDFRTRDWAAGARDAARGDALEALRGEAAAAELTLFPQGGSAENLSVASVESSALVLGRGQRFTIRANLRNHGGASYPSVPVSFEEEGETVRTARVGLGPGEDAQVLFTHAFEEAGEKRITIRAEGDALEWDNAFHVVIPVWEEVPVLLVDGDPSDAPLEGETDFLEVALRPFEAAGGGELADLIRPRVTTENRVRREELERARVVIVANCRNLSGISELRDFVLAGGGLIFFPGDEVDVKWWDKEAHGSKARLLPCPVGAIGSAGKGEGGGRVGRQRFNHPALAFFNDPANGRFDGVQFSLWHRLDVGKGEGGEEDEGRRVLLRLDNGDPLAVEQSFGRGKVIQFATTVDADWGNFPTQPVYLPFMQRLVTYLATTGASPRNLETGESLRAVFPEKEIGTEVLVVAPDGEEELAPVRKEDERGIVDYAGTAAPGFYRMQPAGSPEGEVRYFAANLSREESDLAAMSAAEVDALAEDLGAKVVRNREEYAALDRLRRLGLEVWRPLVAVLLALFFVEMLLQQAIGGRGRGTKVKV